MDDDRIRLADVVKELREELVEATKAGEGQPLRFELGEVKLEAQVVVMRETQGKGGVKFYVLNAELAEKEQVSHTQKVTLTLTPKDVASGGTVELRRKRTS